MEITPDLAEVCGIHAGDGYMRLRGNNKGEVDISGHLEEKDYYDEYVIPLFNEEEETGIEIGTRIKKIYEYLHENFKS